MLHRGLPVYSSLVLVVLLAVPLTECKHHHPASWKDLELFPDPSVDAEKCGSPGITSKLCDPDHVLSLQALVSIDETLQAISQAKSPYPYAPCRTPDVPGYEVAVAVVRQLEVPDGKTDFEVMANFATALHYQWQVGALCNTGMLLVVAAEARRMYVSQGAAAAEQIPWEVVQVIIQTAAPLLEQGRYDEVVQQTVLLLGRALADEAMDMQPPPDWGFRLMLLFAFWLGILATARAYDTFRERRGYRGPQDEGWQQGSGTAAGLLQATASDCRALIELIRKDQGKLQMERFGEVTMCPICMEEFTPEVAGVASSASTAGTAQASRSEAGAQHDPLDEQHTESAPLLAPAPSASTSAPGLVARLAAEVAAAVRSSSSASAAGALAAQASGAPQPARRAMVVKCGHVFCEACLTQWIEQQRKVSCPICRQLLPQASTAEGVAAVEALAAASEAGAGPEANAAGVASGSAVEPTALNSAHNGLAPARSSSMQVRRSGSTAGIMMVPLTGASHQQSAAGAPAHSAVTIRSSTAAEGMAGSSTASVGDHSSSSSSSSRTAADTGPQGEAPGNSGSHVAIPLRPAAATATDLAGRVPSAGPLQQDSVGQAGADGCHDGEIVARGLLSSMRQGRQ